MAHELGLPVDLVKLFTKSGDFVAWNEYLDQEKIDGFDPLHYYLAQIAMEVRRSWVKNPKAVKFHQFMLKFKEEKKPEIPLKEVPEVEILSEDEYDEIQMKRSKAFWGGVTGKKLE